MSKKQIFHPEQTDKDVVKCSADLVDIADWPRFNKEYATILQRE